MKISGKNLGILILFLLYFVGAVTISFRIFSGMEGLSPLHLLITFVFLLYWHPKKNFRFWIWLVVAYIIGTGVEYLGVQYGFLFGSYQYGSNMEPTVLGTPLVIGINWIILSYCFTRFVRKLGPGGWNHWVVALVAATLMTAFDVLIEPVAIELDFWTWAGDRVPWTNYTGWWIVSFVLNYLFLRLGLDQGKNPLSLWVLLFQLFFFIFVYAVRVV